MRQLILSLLVTLSICACAGRQPVSLQTPRESRLWTPTPPTEAPAKAVEPDVSAMTPVAVQAEPPKATTPVVSPRQATQADINRYASRSLAITTEWMEAEAAKIHGSHAGAGQTEDPALLATVKTATEVRAAGGTHAAKHRVASAGRVEKGDHHRKVSDDKVRKKKIKHGKNRHNKKGRDGVVAKGDRKPARPPLLDESITMSPPPHRAVAPLVETSPSPAPPPSETAVAVTPPAPAPIPQSAATAASLDPGPSPSAATTPPVPRAPPAATSAADPSTQAMDAKPKTVNRSLGIAVFCLMIVTLLGICIFVVQRFRKERRLHLAKIAAAAPATPQPAAPPPADFVSTDPDVTPAPWFQQNPPGAATVAPQDLPTYAPIAPVTIRPRPKLPGLPPERPRVEPPAVTSDTDPAFAVAITCIVQTSLEPVPITPVADPASSLGAMAPMGSGPVHDPLATTAGEILPQPEPPPETVTVSDGTQRDARLPSTMKIVLDEPVTAAPVAGTDPASTN